jgi:hypothetical protein
MHVYLSLIIFYISTFFSDFYDSKIGMVLIHISYFLKNCDDRRTD